MFKGGEAVDTEKFATGGIVPDNVDVHVAANPVEVILPSVYQTNNIFPDVAFKVGGNVLP